MKRVLKKFFLSALILSAFSACAIAETLSMVGYCSMRSAKVWVSGEGKSATIICSNQSGEVFKDTVLLDKDSTAVVEIGGLLPNTNYAYKVEASGGLSEGVFTTLEDYLERKPPADFEVAIMGACYFNEEVFDPPFKVEGAGFEVFDIVAKQSPKAVIWASGAGVLKNADFESRWAMFKEYKFVRAQKPLKTLLTSVANIGVPSQNMFMPHGADSNYVFAQYAIDAFKANWANPSCGGKNLDALNTSFKIYDAEFFILDDISFRKNIADLTHKKEFIGKAQFEWLKYSLINSKAKFKIVVMNTSICNPVEGADNLSSAKEEKANLIEFLTSKKISGLVMVSAAKPYFDITKCIRSGGYDLYEIGVGPTTARPEKKSSELNYFKVPSSSLFDRGYAKIKIDGAENDRSITLTICKSSGESFFSQTIKEASLR